MLPLYLTSPLEKSKAIQSIQTALRKNPQGLPAALFGVTEGLKTVLCGLFSEGRRTLVVTSSDREAIIMAEDLQKCGLQAQYFPAREITFFRASAESRELIQKRIAVLGELLKNQTSIVTAPIEALLVPLMPVNEFRKSVFHIESGDSLDLDELAAQLTNAGYVRENAVDGRGQFALRGGILDIFPVQSVTAYRIEMYDDEVDSVRELDVLTQRSTLTDNACDIFPATEAVSTEEEVKAAGERLLKELSDIGQETVREMDYKDAPWLTAEEADGSLSVKKVAGKRKEVAEALSLGHRIEALENYIPYIYDKTSYFSDYFDPELVIFDEIGRVKERADGATMELHDRLLSALEREDAFPSQSRLMDDWTGFFRIIEKRSSLLLGNFQVALPDLKLSALETIESRQTPEMQGQNNLIYEYLEDCRRKKRTVALMSGGMARAERLTEALREKEFTVTVSQDAKAILPGTLLVVPGGLSRGFELPEAGFVLLGEMDLFGTAKQKSARRKHRSGQKLAAFTDLKVGDFVVHDSHGIGIYQGITRMTVEGKSRDYLHISYQGTDTLYVPTDQLDRVQKYIGSENHPPRINKLGGAEWQRSKSRVRHEIMEMAEELIKLYAARQSLPGFAFSPDTPWQRDFESDFPFEETPDQLQCIEEIKKDMQQPHPMDRLLCGDVGYGKTEVAVRAAFKAVMDSKQVAILVPTTVLAQQHYNSIRKRFEHFPVRIEMLSRFRTAAEIKNILTRLREGEIDIVIGTHKLLGKDVRFKNLGLLIIDEEQRFGVKHKETLKQLKTNVDVLTLSATPIPRTLNMSMVGIRDMSLLETPPEERYPVQTYVLEYSDSLVRDAILRELSRGGQVYLLYNRVVSITRFYEHIRALVPEARVAVGHGQMRENALEDVMLDFYEGQYDVLICSTIIESGLDVATANTMIVCDADRFGLSQLYQLRGRVGRSNRLAYCYLTVPPGKVLTEVAEKRLSAIREFTEFGSGFKVAMRDMEIRGAGNLLGSEQHGRLSDVGYDLYCRMMEQAVAELRGQEVPMADLETKIELKVDAYLPQGYVTGDSLRMDVYKRIASIESRADFTDVMDEMIDRFGDVPPEVENLLWIALLKSLCHRMGIEMVFIRLGRLTMRFSDSAKLDGEKLIAALNRLKKDRLLLQQVGTSTALVLDQKGEPEVLMEKAVSVMEKLVGEMFEEEG